MQLEALLHARPHARFPAGFPCSSPREKVEENAERPSPLDIVRESRAERGKGAPGCLSRAGAPSAKSHHRLQHERRRQGLLLPDGRAHQRPGVPELEHRADKNDVMSFDPLEVMSLDDKTGLMNYYVFEPTQKGKPGKVTRVFRDSQGNVLAAHARQRKRHQGRARDQR